LPVVGCTYLDVLQKKIADLPKSDDAVFTVLVAPSWGPSAILTKYGASLLDALVQTGFHIIVRPHPQSKLSEKGVLDALEAKYQGTDNLEWDYNPENLSSLSRADIMISDFSGVVFDYSFLFDRPFLYVNSEFDARPYDSYDIEEQPWIFRVLPEIGIELKVEDFGRIKDVLVTATEDSTLSANRRSARDVAWQYRGESGERVAEYLIGLLNSQRTS
jgi:CDP-glycerol glycerophosphotransferase (TagB/SpsB family)